MRSAVRGQRRSGRALAIYWTEHDAAPMFTRLCVVVVAGAAVFTIVGMPDLPFMWPMYHFGVVAPTCGLTRGVVSIARADFGRAWAFNPASFIVVTATLAGLGRATTGWRMGRWLSVRVLRPRSWWVGLAAFTAALWINQQLHADFLIHQLR